MHEEKMTVRVPLRVAAMDCGGQVLKGLVVLAGLTFGGGWFLENREFAWGLVMLAVSLGGFFWGAVVVGVASAAVAFWNDCVKGKAKGEYPDRIHMRVLLSVAGVWFLSFLAGWRFSPEWGGFSGYDVAGMGILCASFFVFVVFLLMAAPASE